MRHSSRCGALAGDLDNIVMQALRKEPEWRYQTAADLRDDITRYLEGRPSPIFPTCRTAAACCARYFRRKLAGRAADEVAGHQPAGDKS